MMKFLSILVAASLALTPAIASAGSSGDSTDNGRPISGPLAGEAGKYVVPIAPVVLGVVTLGVALIVFLGGENDSNNDTN